MGSLNRDAGRMRQEWWTECAKSPTCTNLLVSAGPRKDAVKKLRKEGWCWAAGTGWTCPKCQPIEPKAPEEAEALWQANVALLRSILKGNDRPR